MNPSLPTAALLLIAASSASAQSLFLRGPDGAAPRPGAPAPSTPAPAPHSNAPAALPGRTSGLSAEAAAMSMISVTPPAPKTYAKHDLIQIIINEQSIQKYEQTLDSDKKYDANASLKGFPSIRHLLEAQLEPGDSTLIDVEGNTKGKFKGKGTMERKDKFATRITAEIVEVKPNGLLVIEARKAVESDNELQTLVVAGACRPEDITLQNTVSSTQLLNLVIRVHNDGDVREAAKKGWFPRVMDTVFGM